MTDTSRHLCDLIDVGDTMMLMTMVGDRHSSRPMTVAGVEDVRLSFLVDATADWYGPVASGEAMVHVTLSDVRHNEFAALNGVATTTTDSSAIDPLWSAPAGAYFDGGRDDPNVAVLFFDVTDGEYWDGPTGRLGALLSIVKAAVGRAEDAGDHGGIAT